MQEDVLSDGVENGKVKGTSPSLAMLMVLLINPDLSYHFICFIEDLIPLVTQRFEPEGMFFDVVTGINFKILPGISFCWKSTRMLVILFEANRRFAYQHPALTFTLQDVFLSDRNCCATPLAQK
ncbi:hypothetical protein [Pedobacter sp. GR22-6]|uniref:hypothetical protein n=1 Tax=Pedobacter sp. GR22-6 TaxID=3127957 RepID=UPI00307CF9EB